MKKTKVCILVFLSTSLICESVIAESLYCPSVGVEVDIAVHENPIWFFNAGMPILFTGDSLFGLSVTPSFSFNSSMISGFIAFEGLLVLPLVQERADLILGIGGGVGAYSGFGLSELLPVLTGDASLMIENLYLRFALNIMVKNKYYSDLDSSLLVSIGYAIGGEK